VDIKLASSSALLYLRGWNLGSITHTRVCHIHGEFLLPFRDSRQL
jgi:hypothetical protein